MFEPFFITFREALQCALLLALVLYYPSIRGRKFYAASLVSGVVLAFLAGFPLGYLPALSKALQSHETWTFWRYLSEAILFSLSILFVARPAMKAPPVVISVALFALGFSLFFFESRAAAFIIQDMGAMHDNVRGSLVSSAGGLVAGFAPLILFKPLLRRIPFKKAFTLPSLLMTIGALQFGFGGVAELERENILTPLQRGLQNFLGDAVRAIQETLLIPEHPFLDVTGDGLARFIGGDRTALMLTVIFIMTPPVLILIQLFARPDPIIGNDTVAAQRRTKIAFFRNELFFQTVPVLTVFTVLVIMLHAVNVSMNPLYEPTPVPVSEAEQAKVIKIPFADKLGDLSDKKLRKYVYYYGAKQIIFIAILKADGAVGVALDECEICRPADWNTDAKGYAQKGEHLICKYCMTPIATSTVNNPGGCNPIPIPFSVQDGHIVIRLADLTSIYDKTQALEKKGTHL